MDFPNKKYKVIYADPPWAYKVWSAATGSKRSAESHYPTMQPKDISDLDVQSIADDDCTLFIWVTYPCLEQGLQTIKDWGFTYKTCAFTWVKRNKKSSSWFWGMGYWTRSNPEICLLATKGKPRRVSAKVHSVIDNPISRHSEKPAIIRDRIVELMGDVPRIELFARKTAEGWDSWGNEV